jgi:hypothetical protein
MFKKQRMKPEQRFEDTEAGARLIAESADAHRRLREAERAKRFDPELEAARDRLQQANNRLRDLQRAPVSAEQLTATVEARRRGVACAEDELSAAPQGERKEQARVRLERARAHFEETHTWRFDAAAVADYHRRRDAHSREIAQLEADLTQAESEAMQRAKQSRKRAELWDLMGKPDELNELREAAARIDKQVSEARKAYADKIRPQLDELRQMEAKRMRSALLEAQSAGHCVHEIECQMRSHGIPIESTLVPYQLRQPGNGDTAAVHAHYGPIMRDARSMAERVQAFFSARGYN